MMIDDCLNYIRAFIMSETCSRNKLTKSAGIADRTLKDVLEPDWDPRVSTVRKVADAIKLNFSDTELTDINDSVKPLNEHYIYSTEKDGQK